MDNKQSRTLLSKELLGFLDDINQRKKSKAESRKSSVGSGNSGKNLTDPTRIKLNSLPGFIRLGSDDLSSSTRMSFPLIETTPIAPVDSEFKRQSSLVNSRAGRLAGIRNKMSETDKLRSNTWSTASSLMNSPCVESLKPITARMAPLDIYLSSITDPLKDPREALMTVKYYRLTRGELRNWLEGSSEVSHVVDAYFSVLQDQNRIAIQGLGYNPRVLLGNTDISRAVFAKSDSIHCDEYLFRHDLAIYPLYEQNWGLVLVDVRERKVTYFDPTRRNKDFTEMLIDLFRFFKSEMAYHENRNIEETTWRDMSYLSPDLFPRFQPKDSAGVICKIAEQLTTSQRIQLQTCLAGDYRREVVQTLVSHSLRL